LGEKLSLATVVSLRLTDDDRSRLDAVAARLPVVPRLTLARIALRMGLEVIAKNPSVLLSVSER
jgi:hypothetical protein